MYYGGDPPAWTTTPAIPADARYERLSAAASAATAATTAKPTASSSSFQQPVGKRIEKSAHPLSGIGGFRMPAKGTIGGARGVGVVGGGVSKVSSSGGAGTAKSAAAAAAAKTTANGKPMSQEEKEAIAKREAARARMAARNAAQFGM